MPSIFLKGFYKFYYMFLKVYVSTIKSCVVFFSRPLLSCQNNMLKFQLDDFIFFEKKVEFLDFFLKIILWLPGYINLNVFGFIIKYVYF